jgi:hypothetical protein
MIEIFKSITMRKVLLTLLMAVGGLVARADGYAYLTFETADGARASVAVESLALSISGTTLTAGTQTFNMSNLTKMYFSNADETTGIEEVTDATLDEAAEIYDLQGRTVSREQMKKGAYIIKTKQKTYKIVVR